MSLESGTYVKDLVETNPTGVDAISQGDNHLRLIKFVLKNSFPSESDGPIIPDTDGHEGKYLQVGDSGNTAWSDLDIASLTRNVGSVSRANFIWNSPDKLLIEPGIYDLDSKGRTVTWNEVLEKTVAATGGFSYVYIKASGVTSGVALTANEFIVDSSVPTYDPIKRGWYNGDDRCIFTVNTNGGLQKFWHNNDYVHYEDQVHMGNTKANGWQVMNCTAPPIGPVMVQATLALRSPATYSLSSEFRIRSNSGNGHYLGKVEAGSGGLDDEHVTANLRQITYIESNQAKVQVFKSGGDAPNVANLYIDGFYLPNGM
jgi:hypothetical protein